MNIDIDLKKLRINIQPHVMAGILSLNDESDMSFTKLDQLVRADQNMTALILKAANSSLYSRGREVTTLQHALGILGFQVVRSLAMVATSKALFEAGNYSRFRRLVWEHSVVTAIVARHISERVNKKDFLEEAFIAGLLHDIGKVLLNIIDRKKFIEVINMVTEKKIPFADAETEVFGFNHLELGRMAGEEWKLPAIYHPVISGHMNISGEPNGEEDHTLLHIVSYANFLAKKNGHGFYCDKDDADGETLEGLLEIDDKAKQYFTNNFERRITNDDFYKFFMTVV